MNVKAIVATLALLGAMPAQADTSYIYESGLIGTSVSPSPFGERFTGSVTFHFDTANFTGHVVGYDTDHTLWAGGDSSVFSNTYHLGGPGAVSWFDLTDGAITRWHISWFVSCSLSVTNCAIQSGVSGLYPDLIVNDRIFTQCASCEYQFASAPSGTWTMVSQVPSPVIGAGWPGLLALWLVRKRVRRRI